MSAERVVRRGRTSTIDSVVSHKSHPEVDFVRGKTTRQGPKERLLAFFSRAYDSEKKELWGRDLFGWGLLIVFYLCFYIGLLLFFTMIWLLWTKVILNLDSPLYSGPEEGLAWTPGVSMVPIMDPERKSTLIRFARSNQTHIDRIKKVMYNDFLEGYEPPYWNSENGNFIDCLQGRTDSDPEKVCEFPLDLLGRACILEDDYGFGDGTPCLIFKLNKINNWVPENYYNISEVPEEIRDVWRPNYITLRCYGTDPISNEALGALEYFPQQGWSFDYYPFTGQQGYKSPLVAVQFKYLPQRTLLFITCKAYTKNMIYDASYGLGMVRFELISD